MSSSDIFFGEVIGTAMLVLLGGGVCAAVTFKRSKASNAGWVAIAFGWGMAVLVGGYVSVGVSGAHLNPAVTLALAIEGTTPWGDVPLYFASELLGAMIGAVLVWLTYYGQFHADLGDMADRKSENPGPVHGVFFTSPEIRNTVQNLVTEIIATFVLIIAILTQGLTKEVGLSGVGVLLVALTVVGIGLSLGGPTGYAINPVRDLGPRIVHALLPLPNKGGSDWNYSWIPVAGPLIGAAIAAGVHQLAFA
ncbi:glycerol transporter [Streptomyces abyssalis]|uniref:Glycerol transporter n=1 Tax=Streptomyces abyssalis TaxID=933944 RepID=A0A1E7JUL0_9ACTN|nr:MIP/aquaporin family protein [Streptomyces abyssalis]OEU89389.1 glycerol transporter [Streptomyces abyssalis]OEU93641.1 glycerol transporter [Streptomyces abyssalis]OEV29987.1 glycerol transporter [Streptomyces nanshensis]